MSRRTIRVMCLSTCAMLASPFKNIRLPNMKSTTSWKVLSRTTLILPYLFSVYGAAVCASSLQSLRRNGIFAHHAPWPLTRLSIDTGKAHQLSHPNSLWHQAYSYYHFYSRRVIHQVLTWPDTHHWFIALFWILGNDDLVILMNVCCSVCQALQRQGKMSGSTPV